jgi:hypothetical protein
MQGDSASSLIDATRAESPKQQSGSLTRSTRQQKTARFSSPCTSASQPTISNAPIENRPTDPSPEPAPPESPPVSAQCPKPTLLSRVLRTTSYKTTSSTLISHTLITTPPASSWPATDRSSLIDFDESDMLSKPHHWETRFQRRIRQCPLFVIP